MRPLSDQALHRLRAAATEPDFQETRYRLIRELGRGGMGTVYLAEDSLLNRKVAIKVFHLDDASPALAARMRHEARTLASLEHPNIVPVYDFGQLPCGRLYYSMKFVEGSRLDEQLSQSLPRKLRLFDSICEAVAYAHARGVIHRDLKPANIMIGAFGEVLVMDWGLAKIGYDAHSAGHVLGTPHYMAPEQARAEPHLDARADIYSLGRILEFLCAAEAPKPVQSMIRKACHPDPASRYAGAQDLGLDALRFLDGMPVTAHKESPFELAVRFFNNNRTLLLLVFTYAAMRFLVFFFSRR
ncbi:MAG: serine/threonine protein kinase [Bryobacterales bacterium]|nr:serine/threonine protein kinase [Bryobacterales bacterium]